MSMEDDIFNKVDTHYTAIYGWQDYFGKEYFSFGYIDSYKSAADLLIDQHAPDLFIFPVMFSYRQYLELVLKNICYRNMDESKYVKFIKMRSHNLQAIWRDSKMFLKEYISGEELEVIERAVSFFYRIDPNSFNFRFESDKKNNKSIKENLRINMKELRKWMNKVDEILRFTYDE
ncbi:hypothetical protein [uncultured Clostridium sp.]|uniref:hypothetical protein n=1 Tax=uncultured Clostridium sp. TaxID=59620 RepID=UPI002731FEE8|nr:hypothetical protein [uncultured Clostridium sp.]